MNSDYSAASSTISSQPPDVSEGKRNSSDDLVAYRDFTSSNMPLLLSVTGICCPEETLFVIKGTNPTK